MLEGLHRVFSRIDDLNDSFRGMAPRHQRREKQNFSAVLNELQKTDLNKPKKPVDPVQLQITPEPVPKAGVQPLPQPSSASKAIPDYSELINTYATKFNVDPALVRRVMEVESGFDSRSVSSKGAIGLMQLMPDTARELGVTNPFDPAQNIEGGTKYLSMLLEKNGGDLSRALASYNAGPGAVRQYGGVPPFKETQQFVQRVLSGLKTQSEGDVDE